MQVSMRAFQSPSRLCREYGRYADGCQHFFFDNAKKSFVQVSMSAFMLPSKSWREYDRFEDSCQHFFSIMRKKVLRDEKPKRKTALIGKKRRQSSLIGTVTGVFDFGSDNR